MAHVGSRVPYHGPAEHIKGNTAITACAVGSAWYSAPQLQQGLRRRAMGMYKLNNLGSKYRIVQDLGPRFPAIGF